MSCIVRCYYMSILYYCKMKNQIPAPLQPTRDVHVFYIVTYYQSQNSHSRT